MSEFKKGDWVEYDRPGSWHIIGTWDGFDGILITEIKRTGDTVKQFKVGEKFVPMIGKLVKPYNPHKLPEVGSVIKVCEVITGTVLKINEHTKSFIIRADKPNEQVRYSLNGSFGEVSFETITPAPIPLNVGDIVDVSDPNMFKAVEALPTGSVVGGQVTVTNYGGGWSADISYAAIIKGKKKLIKILQIGQIEW